MPTCNVPGTQRENGSKPWLRLLCNAARAGAENWDPCGGLENPSGGHESRESCTCSELFRNAGPQKPNTRMRQGQSVQKSILYPTQNLVYQPAWKQLLHKPASSACFTQGSFPLLISSGKGLQAIGLARTGPVGTGPADIIIGTCICWS